MFPPIDSLHVSLNSIGTCDVVGISAKDVHDHSNHCIFDHCLKFSLVLCPLSNPGLARQICSLCPYTHCNYPCFSNFRMDYICLVKITTGRILGSCHCTLPFTPIASSFFHCSCLLKYLGFWCVCRCSSRCWLWPQKRLSSLISRDFLFKESYK